MRTGLITLIALLLGAFPASAEKDTLELRGRIIPPLKAAWVGLQAATEPFRAETLSDLKGNFKFKGLRPGAYALIVFHPRWGEQRRSIEVTPSFADRKHRVEINFVVRRSKLARERHAEKRHTVSVLELSVSEPARAEFLKGNEQVGKHDIEGAVRHLKKAVEISPQFVEVWNQLGTIFYQRGDYEQAEEYFREALSLESDAFGPVVNMGAALLALGRHDDALSYNRYAATLHPDDALANSQLGRNHFLLGSHEEAIKYLRKAKGIDPNHFSLPQITLAEIYTREGNIEAAIRELEDYVARHPDSQRAEATRETLARLKSDLEKAAAKKPENEN